MSSHRAHNPARRGIWCDKCRHHGYYTRGDAKAVRKQFPGERLSVFVCPHRLDDEPDLFHLGRKPVALTRGVIDRTRMSDEKRTAHARRHPSPTDYQERSA